MGIMPLGDRLMLYPFSRIIVDSCTESVICLAIDSRPNNGGRCGFLSCEWGHEFNQKMISCSHEIHATIGPVLCLSKPVITVAHRSHMTSPSTMKASQ